MLRRSFLLGTMMSKILYALAAAAACVAAAPADDSTAALKAGGIVFTGNTPLRMAEETLYISPLKVRIRFGFANDTDKPVETLVAFPLPDIDMNEFTEEGLGAVTADPVNFVGFTATVNGAKVPLTVEQRAFYKGKDVSAALKAAGAPLNVVGGANYKKLDALKGAARQALIAADLADDEGEGHLHPHWTLQTRFYWKQIFPAHRTLIVEHSYQPVTGAFLFTGYDLEKHPEDTSSIPADFCMDESAFAAARAKLKALKGKPDSTEVLTAYVTDYILKTATNWHGPIGKFHLILDKVKPARILSLCWDGRLVKTSPTVFETTLTDFTPKRDIHLMVLE
jgi:hypothetical protein